MSKNTKNKPTNNISSQALTPPIARQIPTTKSIHGRELIDPYAWLRDKDNPDVIAYLEDENAYTDAMMAHTKPLQNALFNEIVARINEDDLSVPYRHGDFYYYTRYERGKDYPIYCRKFQNLDSDEEILLDTNVLAQGHDYFELGAFEVNGDHSLLAYSTDTTGNERYTLYIKDLRSGELFDESIIDTSTVAWGNNSDSIYYITVDEANRPFKVFRHQLGSASSEDVLLFHEPDDAFYAYLDKTRSNDYIRLTLWSISSGEVHLLDATNPAKSFQVVAPRQPGVEYSVEHHDENFYIVTNENATNFKVMTVPVNDITEQKWSTFIDHRDEVMINGIQAFSNFLVISERANGVPRLYIWDINNQVGHHIQMPEEAYAIWGSDNPEFDSSHFRFRYSSMITPETVFDYDINAGELIARKETEIKNYDRAQFETSRIYATANDGTSIPISVVHKRGLQLDGSNPLLLVGYGSYGSNYDPYFSASRVSLMERGVIFAIAHIRGGSEMGRAWYEQGKLEHKMNTFTDFIACAEHLIEIGFTSSNRLAINGGSAGGLLMGAVINERPELFHAVVADVPFVDVINTMLDDTLPLTVVEYTEWGNPNDKEAFETMIAYSPYENVREQVYPHLLVTAGLNDPRVGYWEPAKWVSKLRVTKSGDNKLLLQTQMGAGHGGASGRYDRYREIAFMYAFILEQLGVE